MRLVYSWLSCRHQDSCYLKKIYESDTYFGIHCELNILLQLYTYLHTYIHICIVVVQTTYCMYYVLFLSKSTYSPSLLLLLSLTKNAQGEDFPY